MIRARRWSEQGSRHLCGVLGAGVLRAGVLHAAPGRRHAASQPDAATAHAKQLQMLDPPDLNLTYPPASEHLTPRHFYQVAVRKWLARKPRPLTVAQMVRFGRHMSEQKIIAGGNHVAEELTIRFAHRIRMMQALPYRIMGHPELLDTYEKYLQSFEMLRQLGTVRTPDDNARLLDAGQELLRRHTRVVANAIRAVMQMTNELHKPEDVELLNSLLRSLLASRLSRRVLVKQHAQLTEEYLSGFQSPAVIGLVTLECRITDALRDVEARSKTSLAALFNVPIAEMPPIIIEGSGSDEATFPYIWSHLEFILGELVYNSIEACLRNGITEPILVTVTATPDTVLVRISDRAGGLDPRVLDHIWSFTKPVSTATHELSQLTPHELSEHQFYSLLFPPEELREDHVTRPDRGSHLGMGLALARLYTEYWGGALELHSLEGFGCDVLLRLSRRGSNRENLSLS